MGCTCGVGLIIVTCAVVCGFYPVAGEVTAAVSSTLMDLSILTESVLDLKLMEEGIEAEAACREGETARKFLNE